MSAVHSLLALSAIPGLGPLKIRSLVTHFTDPDEVLRASPRELVRVRGIDSLLAKAISSHTAGKQFADKQLQLASNMGATIVTLWDDGYPYLLRKIYDPPPFLFVAGELEPVDRCSIALVGTRTPSIYGRKAAEIFATSLAQIGLTVVSGLARGIDTIAHQAVLRAKGRTLAVIGSGLDVPYPPENRLLMRQISSSGAVVSEFPMGTKPDAHHFPRRNRIISGLSLGALIVESREDGGAMITATTSLDQNREVFAVPGSIYEQRSAGPNRLIREGRAKLVETVEDILEEFQGKLAPGMAHEKKPKPLPPLTLFEERVFRVLGEDPMHIDMICEQSGMPASDALVSLLSLEFKRMVKQLPGKMFVRS